jgi:uroporphyrinogen decarboxylase
MDHRENWIKAATFQSPDWIPCSMKFSPMNVRQYGRDLGTLMREHPRIFPEFDLATFDFHEKMPPVYRKGELHRDNWGCVWDNAIEGLEGQVVGHPLADWSALAGWQPPDPTTKSERAERDWSKLRVETEDRKRKGLLTHGDGERLFDRLYFLRGFENLMMDFAEERPELDQLIALLSAYEHRVVDEWLKIGVDVISFHTDIGTQQGLMISPTGFRRHLESLFEPLFRKIRQAGTIVMLSSDGRILEIIDDLVGYGLQIHDPQLRANGLADIKRSYKGKLCINLDLDRQSFPFLTPGQLRDQVASAVDALYDPRGGLMLLAAIYGDVPLKNIVALCEAFEQFCFTREA